MINNFRQKFKQLPISVQDVISLDVCNEVNTKLRTKYRLTGEQLSNLLEIMDSLFFQEITVDDFVNAIVKLNNEKTFAGDVLGMRFLIIDDYFSGAISKKIKSLGFDIKTYSAEITRQKKGIEQYNQSLAENNRPDLDIKPVIDEDVYNTSVSPAAELQDAEKLFREKLVAVLTARDDEMMDILADYNLSLLNVLVHSKDADVAIKKISRALLANQEKLTFKDFYLEGKPTRPTVGHWLKDFIKQFGAAMPDNLQITRYLTGSKNIKVLDAREKENVGKLLQLYRNIVFFPNSMPKNIDDWEIFPIKKSHFSKVESYKTNIHGEKNSSVGKQDLVLQTKPATAIIKPLKQTENASILAQLENMARQHPQESLERRAIEEEIAKEKRKR